MNTLRILTILTAMGLTLAAGAKSRLTGTVTADGKPLAGALVSDGVKIAKTNSKGQYSIKSDKSQGLVFIISPSGYEPVVEDGLCAAFWHELKADKSHESHDFSLRKVDQSHATMLLFSDCHFTNSTSKKDLANFEQKALPIIKDIHRHHAAKGPVYTLSLGDFTHDLYWYEFNFNELDAKQYFIRKQYPAPFYCISGNHDNDAAITGPDTDRRSEWCFRKAFGPEYYSMNIGGVHWIMLDDIYYTNKTTPAEKIKGRDHGIKGTRSYDAHLTPNQIKWIAEDLKHVDAKTQVCVCAHIPFVGPPTNKIHLKNPALMKTLDSLFAKFDTVRIYSGHTHRMNYCQNKDYPRWHQYILPALSGNMWTISNDAETIGVDGTPAGFVATYTDNGRMSGSDYYAYEHLGRIFRYYDMNSVARTYSDSTFKKLLKKAKTSMEDFSTYRDQNKFFINYYFYKPGYKVEAYESGQPIALKQETHSDPYFIITNLRLGYKSEMKGNYNTHLWVGQASAPDTPIEIRIIDPQGRIVAKDLMRRPLEIELP